MRICPKYDKICSKSVQYGKNMEKKYNNLIKETIFNMLEKVIQKILFKKVMDNGEKKDAEYIKNMEM